MIICIVTIGDGRQEGDADEDRQEDADEEEDESATATVAVQPTCTATLMEIVPTSVEIVRLPQKGTITRQPSLK